MTRLLSLLMICTLLYACETVNMNYQEDSADPEYLHQSLKNLTDIIVHDIFSPPVAARIYVYPSIAAYEVLRLDHKDSYHSLVGQLNGLNSIPQPEEGAAYCLSVAAIHAFNLTGKALIFSEPDMEAFMEKQYEEFEKIGIPKAVYTRSMEYGKQVSEHILAWAGKDQYNETRTMPKYDVTTSEPHMWKPTPPDYMDGIEPNWREIRTMVLDSPQQFTPPLPTEFSLDKNSTFYAETMEVYEVGKNLNKEQKEIAQFWDCNPYVSHHAGHAMYATKKITPGGHWMGIAEIAAKTAKADMMKAASGYALTSIALMDAFISCWDEKYRSNLIRPETVINSYIDTDWRPLLQTPPFPEYTSGHSVISRAAATALTHVYGDNFAFEDTVEVEYGLPVRSFKSFYHASDEAAVSRLYGGIHYRPACDNGVEQGEKLGKYIVSKLTIQNKG